MKLLWPIVVLLPMIAGCPTPASTTDPGMTQPPPPADGANTSGPGSFDGVVRSTVQRVSADAIQRDLLDRTGDTFRFAAGSASTQNAAPGEVVLFDGVAGGRVRSVENDGDAVVVTLEDVPLTEFIENGTLTWDKTLLFSANSEPELLPGFEDNFTVSKVRAAQEFGVETEGGALTSFTFNGTLNGFDVEVELGPESGRLNVRLGLKRSVNGREVFAATATGFLENMRQLGDLDIASGTTRRAQFELKDLRGEVEIEWAAFNPGAFFPDDLFQMQIPVVFPFRAAIGPIPITVKVGILGRVLAQLSLQDMSSRGSIKVSFDGEGGLVIDETSVRPLGGSGIAHELGLTGETTTAGAATVALSMGIQFPHVEVGILLDSAKAFITVDTFVTGFFEPGLLSNVAPCQSVEVQNRGVAGYSVSLLGLVELASGEEELWKNERKWVSEGSTCDE